MFLYGLPTATRTLVVRKCGIDLDEPSTYDFGKVIRKAREVIKANQALKQFEERLVPTLSSVQVVS